MIREWTVSLLCSISSLAITISVANQLPKIRIVSPGFLGWDTTASLWHSQPALLTGITYLNGRYPQYNWTSELLTAKNVTDCPSMADNVQFLLAQWFYRHRGQDELAVIVTPGCQQSGLMNVLAASWDILLITGMDYKANMENREINPTFLTTSDTTPTLSILYCSLIQKMQWSKLYMVHDRSSAPYYIIQAGTIIAYMKSYCTIQVTRNEFKIADNDSVIISILNEFNTRSRVMLFFGNANGLRRIMTVANRLNMTQGEHVYLGIRPYDSPSYGPTSVWLPLATDPEDLRKAYQSVILMTLISESLYETPVMKRLITNWQKLGNDAYASQNRSGRYEPNLPSLVPIGTALELVGVAVNQTYTPDLIAHGQLPSGTVSANQLLNRTFNLRTGEVHMMANAQVSHHQSVYSFDLPSGTYKVCLRSSVDSLTDFYYWDRVGEGLWFGQNVFPPDEPFCGFDGQGEACQRFSRQTKDLFIAGITIGLLLILALSVLLFWMVKRQRLWLDRWWDLDSGSLRIKIWTKTLWSIERQLSCSQVIPFDHRDKLGQIDHMWQ